MKNNETSYKHEGQSGRIYKYSESAIATLMQSYKLLSISMVYLIIVVATSFKTGMAEYLYGSISSLIVFFGMLGVLILLMLNRNSPYLLWFHTAFITLSGIAVSSSNVWNIYESNPGLILMASLATLTVFLSTTLYAYISGRDFSFLGGYLFAALLAMIVLVIVGIVMSQGFFLVILSGFIILLFTAYCIYDTSQVLHGHETNYVIAAVSFYLNIINLFQNFLNIFSFFDE